jgi:Derlin-2/3
MYLGGYALLHALSMALTYTFSQEDPNRTVGFFIVQMPAKYVPYASLAVTFLMAGPFMTMIQATGIIAGHAYEFLDKIWPKQGGGKEWVKPPQIVQKWFPTPGGGAQTRAYGTAFAGNAGSQAAGQANRSAGWTSGSAWSNRGAGRRLGSD